MEDYAMLLELIIKEMMAIASDEVVSTKKLSQLIDSAKQYVDSHNKGPFTMALNNCRRYIKSKRLHVTPMNELKRFETPHTRATIEKDKKRIHKSITAMSRRYCNHVMSL